MQPEQKATEVTQEDKDQLVELVHEVPREMLVIRVNKAHRDLKARLDEVDKRVIEETRVIRDLLEYQVAEVFQVEQERRENLVYLAYRDQRVFLDLRDHPDKKENGDRLDQQDHRGHKDPRDLRAVLEVMEMMVRRDHKDLRV